ncbi:MAG: CapA family protein [Candidatus Pacebacteria bacterium]|nr:CapA family protein [Candidatus Paceibacterota bacterium]
MFLTLFSLSYYACFTLATQALAPAWERAVEHTPLITTHPPMTLTFVGDMMFDRYVREKAQVKGYGGIIVETAPLFASSTYVFGNLEGPVTTFAPVADYRDGGPNHFRFTFATQTARVLRDYRFSVVTLNNNHITNFGMEGVAQTKEWLAREGVGYVGAPDDPYTPWRTATSGLEIAVYSYSMWHTKDFELLRTSIAAEATSTLTVVLAHWGEEYETVPNATQLARAHALVDAGADLLVGSHPHVIQRKEVYRNVPIYYSLGNFVFDQYFSSEVRCGAVVSYTHFSDGGASTSEAFIELRKDGVTAPSACAAAVLML